MENIVNHLILQYVSGLNKIIPAPFITITITIIVTIIIIIGITIIIATAIITIKLQYLSELGLASEVVFLQNARISYINVSR